MIRVRTLGQCVIEIDGVKVGPDAEIVFAALLLLTLESRRPLARSEIIRLLWPEAEPARAAHCLRQTIYRIRSLGVAVHANRSVVAITDSIRTDLGTLQSSNEADALRFLDQLPHDVFLPAYEPRFSIAFNDWVESQRDAAHSVLRRVLVAGVCTHRARRDWIATERLARRCLVIDPLNEECTLAIAEVTALGGAKTKAVAMIDSYLSEIGPSASDLGRNAKALRRRIAERNTETSGPVEQRLPFVGREEELSRLCNGLRDAAARRGRVTILRGEPGIGKTRLVSEFRHAISYEPAAQVETQLRPTDSRRTFAAFIDLLPKLLRLRGALGCAPESAQHLKRLVELPAQGAAPTSIAFEARALHAQIQEAILDLLDAIATETLLVICVEDAHWIDASSWELIRHIAEWVATRRIYVVITMRHFAQVHSDAAADIDKSMVVEIAPMSMNARRTLLRSALAVDKTTASTEFVNWCLEKCGGNPYYLSELALHGLRTNGRLEVPPSLKNLVHQRIAQLHPLSRRLLQAVAILGKNATLTRVESILGETRLQLLDALDEVSDHRMLGVSSDGLIQSHDLLVEATLEELSPAVAAYLHGYAAEALAPTADDNYDVGLVWDSANHWIASGQPARAATALIRCARHAMELGRPNDTDDIVRAVLSLPIDDPTRAAALELRAHALRAADRWDELVQILSEFVRTERIGGGNAHTEHELQLLSAKWTAGHDILEVVELLSACCADSSASKAHRCRSALELFIIADNLCDGALAARTYDLVRDEVESEKESTREATYCAMIYHAAFGQIEMAERLARTLDEYVEAMPHTREYYVAKTHLAEVLHRAGRVEESFRILKQVHHEARGHSLLAVCLAGRRLAYRALDSGNYELARHWTETTLPTAEKIQHCASLVDLTSARGELELAAGRPQEARKLFQLSAAMWRGRVHARSEAFTLSSMCGTWLAEGDARACASVLPRYLELYQKVKNSADQDQVAARLVRVFELFDQRDEAGTLLSEYVHVHRRGKAPISKELAALCVVHLPDSLCAC